MGLFDRILTQPIFNLLAFIYNFVGDFGVAIIILTIIVRLILWPLVKKQLHQTKLMQKIQPELKKIKKQANGNKMVESQMMMELYREKGVKPFSSILVLIIQLPIFIALFGVIQLFNTNLPAMPESLAKSGDTTCQKNLDSYTDAAEHAYCQAYQTRAAHETKLKNLPYPGIADLSKVKAITDNPQAFQPKLFGLIDLTKYAGEYWPAMVLTLLAAALQFWQSKQIMPQAGKKGRGIREMFKDAAAGKEVDQTEMMTATTGKMIYIFPVLTIFVCMNLPAAVVLYYATQAGVAVIQQHFVLNRDETDLEVLADEPTASRKISHNNAVLNKDRLRNFAKNTRETIAQEAEIITRKASKNQQRAKQNNSSSSGGQTVVRRIKAK